MRKSILLSIFTYFIILLSSGCVFMDQDLNQNTKNQGSYVNANVTNRDDLVKNDASEIIEYHSKKHIKEFSLALGLAPLNKTARRKEFEFRLWINLGSPGDEKLLLIRSSGSDNCAYFYHINRIVDPTSFGKELLGSPKSGWITLLPEISDRLIIPKGLVLDPQFDIDRHEGVIWLEVVEKGEYQHVYYGHHTSFDDGVRIIKLCEYLSNEFGLDIDCRGERTRLGPIG